MIWALIVAVVFIVVAWFAYKHFFASEQFASPEEKASFLFEKGAGAGSFQEFHSRTQGGYNTDFYKMKKLEARGELTVPNLAKQL